MSINLPIQDASKVNDTLLFIDDILQRSQIRFLLLKEVAKQVKDTSNGITPELSLPIIEIGIQQKDLSPITYPTLKTLLKSAHVEAKYDDASIQFEKYGVPVYIKIVRRKYAFFQNPNRVFYRVTEFDLPNPFDGYWKARFFIV